MGKRKPLKFENSDYINSRNITCIRRSKVLIKKAIEVS